MALLDNLIAAWELNEAADTNAIDSHGANDLTDTNGVDSGTGLVHATVRDFDSGIPHYFTLADNTDLSTGDIDFTLEAWVNLETLVNAVVVAKYTTDGNQREYMLYYNHDDHSPNARFSFIVSADGGATTNVVDATTFGAPSTATWYHLVAWHDAANNQLGIAVNAGTADTVSHSTGVFNGTSPFRIGTLFTTIALYMMNGRIGPVRMWKGRVLTAQERTDLYNGGAGLKYEDFDGGGGPAGPPTPTFTRRRIYCH